MMMARRGALVTMAGLASAASLPQSASAKIETVDELNELGPENGRLAQRVGLWDVTETLWATPGAQPVTTTGLVAERVMMGSLLQEFIRPAGDQARRHVARTEFLSFDRLEGRWKYVSFDTRAPVGLMPASSAGPGTPTRFELHFEPFAHPVAGPTGLSGEMLTMRQIVDFESSDKDRKDQYFMLANASSESWLAHRYSFVRRA